MEGFCLVSEMPEYIHRDESGKLHSITESAIRFKDGYELFYINGVKFSKELWEKIISKKITPAEILQLENAEQKTVAIRHYGYENILKDLDCKVIDSTSVVSSKGQVLKYEVIEVDLKDEVDDDPARFVKVQCWTTNKSTLLRVDPRDNQTKDCIGAIAWTARMTKENYLMDIET